MSFKPVSTSGLLTLDKHASQLGITYIESGKNYAIIEIILDDRHLNFMGRCHGGVVVISMKLQELNDEHEQ